MTTHPICKINLGLHVVGRREDGYHNLETVFLPVGSMTDTLTIERADTFSFRQDGIDLDNPPMDNLCVKAYNLLRDEFAGRVAPVAMRLTKAIPFGAGLGGGSSDAAFTLRMLNEMFALGLDDRQLERRAARLGADCAFFVKARPCYATGIGDLLEPIDLVLDGFEVRVRIPEGEHVATREAYGGLDRSLFGQPRPDLREALRLPVGQWRTTVENDFERSVFPSHPRIAQLKQDLYAQGAAYASMTGSGAAVFGLFPVR